MKQTAVESDERRRSADHDRLCRRQACIRGFVRRRIGRQVGTGQQDTGTEEADRFRVALSMAKVCAHRGDLTPLRKLLPSIAEFLHEPRRVRGQRRTPQKDPFAQLVKSEFDRDVERVRCIWRENYDGRWKRHSSDGPSAEEIAHAYRDIMKSK